MINDKLINPGSIVVVGGSDDLFKPGGKVLRDIIEGGYKGSLYVVNPKHEKVQGIQSWKSIEDIPSADLAILAISAHLCLPAVETLINKKGTQAFIIISAGFSEAGDEGKKIENVYLSL